MKWALAFLALLILLYWIGKGHVSHPRGVMAGSEPYQSMLYGAPAWTWNGARITPLADFQTRARVLGIEHYWFDNGSRFSPLDLSIGWGPMSDSAILDQLLITQSGRFFNWRPVGEEFPVPPEEINRCSANLHIVPAGGDVKKAPASLRCGHIVRLSGQLIQIEGDTGWKWRSSLSRTDSGGGAGELVWLSGLEMER